MISLKYKTTRKAVNEGYGTRIEVPYCDLQFMLQYKSPVAYTTRREGWGADIYDFGNVAIVTGYAPFGNFRPGYAICRRFDDAAREIACDHDIPYDERNQRLEALTNRFINKCLDMKWRKAEDDGGL